MDCEAELHKFILKNKPFSENQVVRCEKVDEIIETTNSNEWPGRITKQEDTGE